MEAHIAAHHGDQASFLRRLNELGHFLQGVGQGFFHKEVAAPPDRLPGNFPVQLRRPGHQNRLRPPVPHGLQVFQDRQAQFLFDFPPGPGIRVHCY